MLTDHIDSWSFIAQTSLLNTKLNSGQYTGFFFGTKKIAEDDELLKLEEKKKQEKNTYKYICVYIPWISWRPTRKVNWMEIMSINYNKREAWKNMSRKKKSMALYQRYPVYTLCSRIKIHIYLCTKFCLGIGRGKNIQFSWRSTRFIRLTGVYTFNPVSQPIIVLYIDTWKIIIGN